MVRYSRDGLQIKKYVLTFVYATMNGNRSMYSLLNAGCCIEQSPLLIILLATKHIAIVVEDDDDELINPLK